MHLETGYEFCFFIVRMQALPVSLSHSMYKVLSMCICTCRQTHAHTYIYTPTYMLERIVDVCIYMCYGYVCIHVYMHHVTHTHHVLFTYTVFAYIEISSNVFCVSVCALANVHASVHIYIYRFRVSVQVINSEYRGALSIGRSYRGIPSMSLSSRLVAIIWAAPHIKNNMAAYRGVGLSEYLQSGRLKERGRTTALKFRL